VTSEKEKMKKTILVVDDFASIRQFVCETLEKKGYSTFGASNGNEAFRLLSERNGEINLVLTDYNMPDCTGFELLKKIKGHDQLAAVPVIFLTTESNPDKMKSAREAGLTAWIKKPYRSETFFAQIENAIGNG
jgi:CheY-like chemotaxis protein